MEKLEFTGEKTTHLTPETTEELNRALLGPIGMLATVEGINDSGGVTDVADQILQCLEEIHKALELISEPAPEISALLASPEFVAWSKLVDETRHVVRNRERE